MKWLIGTMVALALFCVHQATGLPGNAAVASEKATGVTVERQIQKRKVVGSNVVRVKEGQNVELIWRTDEKVELHLHGYDIEVDVKPDASAMMRFKAHATGRFPITAHGFGDHHGSGHAEKTLLYLEVHPN